MIIDEPEFKKGDKVVCMVKPTTSPRNMNVGDIVTVKDVIYHRNRIFITFDEYTNKEVRGGIITRLFKLHNDRKYRIENLNLS